MAALACIVCHSNNAEPLSFKTGAPTDTRCLKRLIHCVSTEGVRNAQPVLAWRLYQRTDDGGAGQTRAMEYFLALKPCHQAPTEPFCSLPYLFLTLSL
jgi:hypothetical protein